MNTLLDDHLAFENPPNWRNSWYWNQMVIEFLEGFREGFLDIFGMTGKKVSTSSNVVIQQGRDKNRIFNEAYVREVNSWTDLLGTIGELGDLAYTSNTDEHYIHNGKDWVFLNNSIDDKYQYNEALEKAKAIKVRALKARAEYNQSKSISYTVEMGLRQNIKKSGYNVYLQNISPATDTDDECQHTSILPSGLAISTDPKYKIAHNDNHAKDIGVQLNQVYRLSYTNTVNLPPNTLMLRTK